MPDAVIYKPQHSNGPPAALYDVSNGSGTYIEEVLGAGWDPVNLKPVKLKVDANGQLYIANPGGGGSGGGSGQIVVQGSDAAGTNVGYGSGVLNVPIQGTVTSVPSGTQNVSVQNTPAVTQSGVWSTTVTQGTASNLQATITGTVAVSGTLPVTVGGTVPVSVPGSVTVISGTATNFLAQVSGAVTTTPTGTQTIKSDGGNFIVTQATAANLNATVVGTVTNVPSGTQNVTVIGTVPVSVSNTVTVQGTVTNVPSGTQTTLPTGTLAVSQSGSPWGISGTTTSVPSGTQTVTGSVTSIPSGTQSAAIAGLNFVTDFAITTSLPVKDVEVCERLDNLIAQATLTDTGPGANFALGRVGPQTATDGAWGTNRYDRSGAQIVADGHGRYQEATLRGAVFTANCGNVIPSTGATTVTGLSLYNPINSGKYLVLLNVGLTLAGTVPAQNSNYNYRLETPAPGNVNIAAPSGTTTVNIWPGVLGVQIKSVAIAYSTATFGVAPVSYFNIQTISVAGFYATATATVTAAVVVGAAASVSGAFVDLGGMIAIAPGNYIAVGQGGATAIAANMNITWEEIPI